MELVGRVEPSQTEGIYFIDGVHPTHNIRSTKGWIEVGSEFEQQTVSGRDRVNINGAINAFSWWFVIASTLKARRNYTRI